MKQQAQEFLRAVLIIAAALMVAGVVLHLSFGSMYYGAQYQQPQADEGSVDPAATINSIVCEPITLSLSEKVAILRIDDIQAYAWGETTRLMIDDALARNIPLTLGVIPKRFSDDRLLSQFLRDRLCNLEIALHGWNHQLQDDGVTPEFDGLSESEATTRLAWGLHELQGVFETDIKTWVPPQNVHSDGTAVAAEALGFTRLSTEGDGEWDYDASSYAYDTEELLSPEQVVADCNAQIAEDGKCIIMMHPQVYANDLDHDQQRYEDYYVRLLDLLTSDGYTFARFKDLDTGE